jgi:hypothetical protein
MSKYISGIKNLSFNLSSTGIVSTSNIPVVSAIPGVSIGLNSSTNAAIELNAAGLTNLSYIDFTRVGVDYVGRILYDHTLNEMQLYTNSAGLPQVYINSSGNMGIGGRSLAYKLETTGDICARLGNIRTTGNTGLYNDTYGGGWYMSDSTSMRVYNDKNILTAGNISVTDVNPLGNINILSNQLINFQTGTTTHKIHYDSTAAALVFDAASAHNYYINGVLYLSITSSGVSTNLKTLTSGNISSRDINTNGYSITSGILTTTGLQTAGGGISVTGGGTLAVSPAGNGIFLATDANGNSTIQLNSPAGTGISVIDFSSGGVDFLGRMSFSNVNSQLYLTTPFNVQSTATSTSTTTGALIVSGGVGVTGSVYAGNIYSNGVLLANSAPYTAGSNIIITSNVIAVTPTPSFTSVTTGSITNSGASSTTGLTTAVGGLAVTSSGSFGISPAGNGIFIAVEATDYACIQLNSTASIGTSHIDFSTGGVDFLGRFTFTNSTSRFSLTNSLDITSGIISTSTTTGDLVVAGGVGISGTMYVNNIRTNNVVNSGTSSTTGLTTASGGIYVTGGSTLTVNPAGNGIFLQVDTNNNGNIQLNSPVSTGISYIDFSSSGVDYIGRLSFNNATSRFSVEGPMNFISTTVSTSTTTGALVVAGGAGIGGSLYVGSINSGNIYSTGTIQTTGFVTPSSIGVSLGWNRVVGNGIASLINQQGSGTGGFEFINYTPSNVLVANSVSISGTGVLSIPNPTASTSVTSGALIVAGGVGVSGTMYASNIQTGGFTNTGNTSTTGLTTAFGGLAITGPSTGFASFGYFPSGNGVFISIENTNDTVIQLNSTASTGSSHLDFSTGGVDFLGRLVFANITNRFSFTNPLDITSGVASTSTTTGDLVVAGGVGIAGTMYVNNIRTNNVVNSGALTMQTGLITAGGGIAVTGGATVSSSPTGNGVFLGVDTLGNPGIQLNSVASTGTSYIDFSTSGVDFLGRLSFTNANNQFYITNILNIQPTTASTSTTTGSLVVGGGVGIAGSIYSGNITSVGSVGNTFNSSLTNGEILQLYTPNLAVGNNSVLRMGVGASNYNAFELRYNYSGGNNSNQNNLALGFYGQSFYSYQTNAAGSHIFNGIGMNINMPITISGITTAAGGISVTGGGTLAVSPAGNGIFLATDASGNSTIQLNSTASTGVSVIDFSTGGVDFLGRMSFSNVNSQLYLTTPFNLQSTTASTSTTTGALVVSGGVGIAGAIYAGNIYSNGVLVGSSSATYTAGSNITITSNVIAVSSTPTISGLITANGGISIMGGSSIGFMPTGNGIFLQVDTNNNGNIQLNSPASTGISYIDFSSSGVDFIGRLSFVNATSRFSIEGPMNFISTTVSTSTTTGAIVVAGGAGIGGTLYVGSINSGNIYSGGTIQTNGFVTPNSAGVSLGWNRVAGTGMASLINQQGSGPGGFEFINYTSGNVLVANSISISGTGVLSIPNPTASTSVTSGALIVAGGVGVSGTMYTSNIQTGGFTNTGNTSTTGLTTAFGGLAITGPSTGFASFGISPAGNGVFIAVEATDYACIQLNSTASIGTSHIDFSTGGVDFLGRFTFTNSTSRFSLSNPLDITSGVASTSTTTGDLVVAGGVGIAGTMYVNNIRTNNVVNSGALTMQTGLITAGGGIAVTGGATVSSSPTGNGVFLGVDTLGNPGIQLNSAASAGTSYIDFSTGGVDFLGRLSFTNANNQFYISNILNIQPTTASTSTTTGSLVVGGGVGIAGSIYSGNITSVGSVGNAFNSSLTDGEILQLYTPNLAVGNNSVLRMGIGASTNNCFELRYKYSGGNNSNQNYLALGFYGGLDRYNVNAAGNHNFNGIGMAINMQTTITGSLYANNGIAVTGGSTLGFTVAPAGNGVFLGIDTNGNPTIQLNATASTGLSYIDFSTGGVDSLGRFSFNNANNQFSISAALYLTSGANSTAYTNGTLVISGGIGISGNIYSTGAIQTNGFVTPNSIGVSLGWNRVSGSGMTALINQQGSGPGGFEFINYTPSNVLVANSISISGTGVLSIPNPTDSSSVTSGALIIGGGIGVTGSIYAGNIYSNGVLVGGGSSTYTAGTNITIVSNVIAVTPTPSFSGLTTAAGGISVTGGGAALIASPAGNGVFISVENTGATAGIQLNTTASTGVSYIDFSTGGVDYLGRLIFYNSTNQFSLSTALNVGGAVTSTSLNTGSAAFTYEEGNFPFNWLTNPGGGSTITVNYARYRKIGKQVHIEFSATVAVAGGATFTANFNGLPYNYAPRNSRTYTSFSAPAIIQNVNSIDRSSSVWLGVGSANVIQVVPINSTSSTVNTYSGNTWTFEGSIIYHSIT